MMWLSQQAAQKHRTDGGCDVGTVSIGAAAPAVVTDGETRGTALFRLRCRRGAFPFLPALGSRLHTLAGEKPSARAALARQYCAEALEGMGLDVADVRYAARGDGSADLTVWLTAGGETHSLEVSI